MQLGLGKNLVKVQIPRLISKIASLVIELVTEVNENLLQTEDEFSIIIE